MDFNGRIDMSIEQHRSTIWRITGSCYSISQNTSYAEVANLTLMKIEIIAGLEESINSAIL